MNDETGRLLEHLARKLELDAQVMLAGGHALKASGATLAADSAFLVAAERAAFSDALLEIAAAPADQRVLLADQLILAGADQVADRQFARPVEIAS